MDLSKLSTEELLALKARVGESRAASDLEADRARFNPTVDMSTGQRVLAGAGSAVDTLLRGAKQRGAELLNKVGMVSDETVTGIQAEEVEARRLNKPLTDTRAGFWGNVGGNVAMGLPSMFVPGANTMTGAAMVGALTGATQPTVEGESVTKNAAIGTAAGMGGKVVADKLATAMAMRYGKDQMARFDQKSLNAPRDALLADAHAAGIAVPPTTINPSATNRVLESAAGKINVQQQASINNQQAANRAARAELGVAEDAPLAGDTFKRVLTEANKAYDDLKAVKQFNWSPDYKKGLAGLSKQTPGSVVKNPAAAEIDELVQSLDRTTFTGKELVSTVRQLRREANLASKAGAQANDEAKLAIGKAKRDAANLLEDLAVENLQHKGLANLVEPLKESRVRLAKLHNIEEATDSVGNLDVRALSKQMDNGAPLTGNLEMLAKAGQTWDKAFQDVSKIGSPAVSNLRAAAGPLLSAGGYGLMGPAGVALGAAPFLSPALRHALLSGPYQKAMAGAPNYTSPRNMVMAHALMQNPYLRQGVPAGAAMGAMTLPQTAQ